MGGIWTLSDKGSFGPYEFAPSPHKWHLDRFISFPQLTRVPNTDTWTLLLHATCAGEGCIYALQAIGMANKTW